MRVRKLMAAAGMAASLSLFASPIFAQAPAVGGGGSALQGAPAAGRPGTQAPASAAPVGSASSEAMANGGSSAASAAIPSAKNTHSEVELRRLEVKSGRDIAAARAQGKDVAKAERQRSLGSIALAKGDHRMAWERFNRAEHELRSARMSSPNTNANPTGANAENTDRNPNASNMNPNRGSHTVY